MTATPSTNGDIVSDITEKDEHQMITEGKPANVY